MIRPDDMAAIHAAAFTQSRPWRRDEFSALLSSPYVFACGDTHAFALVRVIADEAELLTIATHPGAQRQGLARALMAQWETQAAARGATRAFLDVAEDNAAARALYLGSGYITAGQRSGYYARGDAQAVDALLMSKDLTQG